MPQGACKSISECILYVYELLSSSADYRLLTKSISLWGFKNNHISMRIPKISNELFCNFETLENYKKI